MDDKVLDKIRKLGFENQESLGLYVPSKYHDHTRIRESLRAHIDRGPQLFKLKLIRDPHVDKNRRPNMIILSVKDNSSVYRIVFFGSEYTFRNYKNGSDIYIKGKAGYNNSGELTILSPEVIQNHFVNKIVPYYPGKTQKDESDDSGKRRKALLKDTVVFGLVQDCIQNNCEATISYLLTTLGVSEEVLLNDTEIDYPSLKEWLIALHMPKTLAQAEKAIETSYRIAAYHVILKSKRLLEHRDECIEASVIDINRPGVVDLLNQLPFKPTSDQLRAISDIIRDFKSTKPGFRLLTGDVGVGKTLAFMIPILAAQRQCRAKVGVMVPNTALCYNLYHEIMSLYPDAKIVHLKRGMRKLPIPLDENPIVIGTQTLLFQKKKMLDGWHPDVLIVDEQQKMSKEQRELLLAPHTNYVEASATAIPKTLAMVSHGDMTYSKIEQCPVNKNIETKLVVNNKSSESKDMHQTLRNVLNNGFQAAFIYSSVNGEDEERSVVSRYNSLNELYPGLVCMLHGKMKDEEKIQAIDDMKKGKFKILIASSVIEVGVTIPEVMFLCCVNPDRYGTSQLHQLRGRVSRKGGDGYFYMYIPDKESEKLLSPITLERLKLLEKYKHNEGFQLAVADMELRGFGNLENDKEKQNGKTNTVFPTIKIMPKHLKFFTEKEEYKAVYDPSIGRKSTEYIESKM